MKLGQIAAIITLLLLESAFTSPSDYYGIATGDPHPDPFHFGVASGWNQIASSGAGWVRFDINENSILDSNGNYALQSEKLNFLNLAHAAGLKTMIIVGAGPGLSISSLTNPWDVPTYAKACQLLAQNNPGLVNGIEVLNEPNNTLRNAGAFLGGIDWRNYLVNMTNAAHAAVAGLVPVIGCGIQGDDVLYCLNLSPQMDGVVYHPYDAGEGVPEHTFEPTTLLPNLGGGAVDYESWVKLVKTKTVIPIWETEFAEDNGSDSYVRTEWLTRRLLMSIGLGVNHAFPFGWIFNACNAQQMVDWANQDPRLPYYAMRTLFGAGGLLLGATGTGTLPTITSTDAAAKGYAYTNNTCSIWSGGKSPSYLAKTDTLSSVSFPTQLTDVGGTYVVNLVSGEISKPQSATLSNGLATISGVDASTEPHLIVLAPSIGPAPTPTPTPTPVPAIPFVTGVTTFDALRNTNLNVWTGFSFTVGAKPITVQSLGRWVLSGNNQIHKLELVRGSDGVVLATVSVPTAGQPSGAFSYTNLSTPVVLSANTVYYVMSFENSGGDMMYDCPATGTQTTILVTADGAVTSAEWTADNVIYHISRGSSANNTYGPVSFTYVIGGTPLPTPTPMPTPTPIAGGPVPAVALPATFKLVWNQDFTSYPDINTPGLTSPSGAMSVEQLWSTRPEGATVNQTPIPVIAPAGTEGQPFSTKNGKLSIHLFNANGLTVGGMLSSAGGISGVFGFSGGFSSANAYWECKMKLSPQGNSQWPIWWFLAGHPTRRSGYEGEVDIGEGAWQTPGTTMGAFPMHLHEWNFTVNQKWTDFGGGSPLNTGLSSLPVTPDGYQAVSVWFHPGSIGVYLNGILVQTFSVDANFSQPTETILQFQRPEGSVTCPLGELDVQYVRCWTQG